MAGSFCRVILVGDEVEASDPAEPAATGDAGSRRRVEAEVDRPTCHMRACLTSESPLS